MARCLNDMGRCDEALSLANQAIAVIFRQSIVDFESRVLLEYSIACHQTGRQSEALEWAIRALRAAESYNYIHQEADVHAILAHFYIAEGEAQKAAYHKKLALRCSQEQINYHTGTRIPKDDKKWHYKSLRYGV
jgi:tetratricopeptide (TPR) repeat protein